MSTESAHVGPCSLITKKYGTGETLRDHADISGPLLELRVF
jgi:hypothetical protein